MTAENRQIVRQPIALAGHPRRRLEERLGLRFPRATVALAGLIQRLPTRSRLRQAVTRRAVELACDATNRGDYEAAFMLYHPDGELIAPQQIVALGLNPT